MTEERKIVSRDIYLSDVLKNVSRGHGGRARLEDIARAILDVCEKNELFTYENLYGLRAWYFSEETDEEYQHRIERERRESDSEKRNLSCLISRHKEYARSILDGDT